ncbi:J domain-containing protein [Thermosulfurimonas dismutans]|uniref:J domain-containing protein n=1 Tax=Thermosulfurimonas dismutans TaxID=999894 RepID=A0A179D4V8_9BACT|nr:J domain-containing protein [Thermosulfurimonas dismutans]OAQ21115.1 hypothetical protein TDIS_0767 [Thermosulfurimonas dismutans]
MRNPFEVLGLSPKIVKELDEESLFRLVKACYRALQQVYHPDLASGSREKALELNLAFEALNLSKNPESFRRHRQAYVRRLSRKTLRNRMEALSLKLGRLFREKVILEEAFWGELVSRARESEHLLSPLPRNLRLHLFDLATKYHLPFPVFGRRAPFKEFLFDEEGYLYLKYARGKTLRKVSRIKMIGCVPREKIEPWMLLEKRPGNESLVAEEYMKAETFRRACLPFLKTRLEPNSYLFSFRNEDFSRVYLEGLILRLSPLCPKSITNVKLSSQKLQICEEKTSLLSFPES